MAKILPILAGLKNMTQRNAYIARAAQILGVAESELRAELNRRGGSAYGRYGEMGQAPLRRAVHQVNDAFKRAGRVVIRAVWEEPVVLDHFVSMVPLESMPDTLQANILRQLGQMFQQGERPSDVMAFQELGEAAVEELSRALVEDLGGQDLTELYTDCVRTLRKNYLHSQFELHRLRADQLSREGQGGYLEELAISQKIKNEMDEL